MDHMDNKENLTVTTRQNDAPRYTDQQIVDMLRRCGHMMHRLPDHGGARRRVLDLLDGESCSQKVLQEALGIQPGSASDLLGKMERDGLIRREPLATDRRGMKVIITDKGLEQSKSRDSAAADGLMDCFTDDEKQQLASLLSRLLEHASDSVLPPPRRRPPIDPRRGRPIPFDPRMGGQPEPLPYRGGPDGRPRPLPYHGKPDHYRPYDGRRPDEGRGDAFRPLPERIGGAARSFPPYEGEEVCIHDCQNCPLNAVGRCVRR